MISVYHFGASSSFARTSIGGRGVAKQGKPAATPLSQANDDVPKIPEFSIFPIEMGHAIRIEKPNHSSHRNLRQSPENSAPIALGHSGYPWGKNVPPKSP
jgi:hypothetical protein